MEKLAREAGEAIKADDRIKKVLIFQHPDNPDNVIIRAVLWKQEGWKDNLIMWTPVDGQLLDSPEFLVEYIVREAETQVQEGWVGQEGKAYYQII